MLVRCSYENLDIFEEARCWWLRTPRFVLSSGIFSGKSRLLFMIARASADSVACYCFCQDFWKYRGMWLSIVGKFFRLQKFDLCSSCWTRGSITCITRIRICIFSNAGAFLILSNLVTRNEIMSIGAFKDDYWNQITSSRRRTMRFDNILNPIGR